MKVLGAMFAVMVIAVMVMYSTAMFGATDEGVDLTGTDYEDQYETQVDMSLINNSIMGVLAPIFMAIILIGAVFQVSKSYR